MKNLRNYRNDKKNIPDAVKENPAFMDAFAKYGGLGEDELIGRLLEQIRLSHENGTYNPGQMESYINMLSPYLNPVQREKLANVVRVINAEKL